MTSPGSCDVRIAGVDGSWRGSSLFTEPGARRVRAPGPLASYCQYEWTPSDARSRATPDLTALGRLDAIDLDPDCEVVAAQGVEPVLEILSAATLDRLGAAQTNTHPDAEHPAVVTAILDTVVDDATTPRSRHGLDVAAITAALACSGAQLCAAQLLHVLALPRWTDGRGVQIDRRRGGAFGTPGDVARAVYQAVARWQTLAADDPAPRLLINLSLGWDPAHSGELVDDPFALLDTRHSTTTPASVRAAYAALVYASCQGALVIVAAGNQATCEDGRGPLAPAAWESIAAPSATTCERLGFATGSTRTKHRADVYRPLVHAIGGVDFRDRPLASTRVGGQPRLVAPAHHVVAGREQAVPVTGTSASAAVASGVAANVWSARPELDGHEVMALIYRAARTIPEDSLADFGLADRPRGMVRRVSLCRARALACEGHACATPPSCESDKSTLDAAALVEAIEAVILDAPAPIEHLDGAQATIWPKDLKPVHRNSDNITRCTEEAGTEPFAWPQPPEFPCDVCTLDDDELTLLPGHALADSVLYEMVLDVETAVAGRQRLSLDGQVAVGGSIVIVDALPISPAWGAIESAILHVTIDDTAGTHAASRPILVLGP
ncbi:MAG: S8/S53 family peptidase [Myxococcales bacterium]|nr:S8/S53 family peptidase [Myxococcales bacterium]